jgi:hypothetical protein
MGNIAKKTAKEKFALNRMCDEFVEVFKAGSTK